MEKELRYTTAHWEARSELLEKEMNRLQKLNGELEKKIVLIWN